MKDRREFAMFAVDLPSHPKLAGATPATRWLDACAVLYCARYLTDGHVHAKSVITEAGVTRRSYMDLVRRGRFHEQGHDCDRCPQPQEDGWAYVHDYLEHNRSRVEAEEQREKASEKGALGNHERWHVQARKPARDCHFCIATGIATGIADAVPNSSPAIAESESESESLVVKEVSSPSLADARAIDGLDLEKIAGVLGSTEAWAAQVAVGIIGRSRGPVRAPTVYVIDSIEREPTKYRPPKQSPSDTPFKRLCQTHGKDRALCGCPARKRKSA